MNWTKDYGFLLYLKRDGACLFILIERLVSVELYYFCFRKNYKSIMSACCVPGCHNNQLKDSKNNIATRKYHHIPGHDVTTQKLKDRRKKWLAAIKRVEKRPDGKMVAWSPKSKSKHCVCSDHFVDGIPFIQIIIMTLSIPPPPPSRTPIPPALSVLSIRI